jgi:hypothetical protein
VKGGRVVPLTSGLVSYLKVARLFKLELLLPSVLLPMLAMYSRMAASSRPTVETSDPRAQKCSPTRPHFWSTTSPRPTPETPPGEMPRASGPYSLGRVGVPGSSLAGDIR